MAVKVQFEIGHTAKLRKERTPDGFTHDWELYVKGSDKADISHFVEKVVFNLHDSFPKPKRTHKESPYVLKESGYAGFILPIDIYFRNRDEPKKVTYSYDLDLQNTGPPVHRFETKKFIFYNPSDEFRQKLLKGGGIPLINNTDEKSRDSLIDERSQTSYLNNSKLSSKSSNNDNNTKKHKIRPSDESKNQTFAALFGTPITKTSNKVSPDPSKANKASPSLSSSSNKISSKSSSDKISLSTGKDKSEKAEKKDKQNKHNSPKEKGNLNAINADVIKETNKKNDEKTRREEKKKDKSHSKERDRSKEKSSRQQQLQQRPPSPLPPPPPKQPRLPSPTLKRSSSPIRALSANVSTRNEENSFKQSSTLSKSNSNVEVADSNKRSIISSTSSSKKSKKEKKSHDKDKERDRKERDRDKKEKDDRTSSTSTSNNNRDVILGLQSTNSIGTNKTSVADSNRLDTYTSKKGEKEPSGNASGSISSKENKKNDAKVSETASSNIEKKGSDKHEKDSKEKDSEKKHKHKKKDKNKEHLSSKEKKKEKSSKKDSDSKKHQQQQSQSTNESTVPLSKSSTNPLSALMHELSDRDSSDTENESAVPSVSEKMNINSESSNSSFPDMISSKNPSSQQLMVQGATKVQMNEIKETKLERKERKTKVANRDKDEKKRKRRNKEDPTTISTEAVNCKSVSPAVGVGIHGEPPIKQPKKNDYYMKNGDRSNSPVVTDHQMSESAPSRSLISPRPGDNVTSSTFRTPSVASNSGGSGILSSQQQQQQQSDRNNQLTVDYMSELRELQQKIMTLQDNNDLQQVVEMIAATGRFEVTNKTFDFDLCALDRKTVQRLQDFLATSVS